MLEYGLIAICTFLASCMAFFSGFGLGTVLMPVVAIFFPLPIAIILTAVVHLIHNLFKAGLLWMTVNWKIVAKFGSAALVGAVPGALLLKALSGLSPIKKYSLFFISGEISILHISIGLLLILFATLAITPKKKYGINNLFLGGALSGFFGGLSGNQGALRSVFLIKTNLDKRAFISTNAVIGSIVDSLRLVIYGLSFYHLLQSINLKLLTLAAACALGGVYLGMLLLGKITLGFMRIIIIVLLYILGVLLAMGII